MNDLALPLSEYHLIPEGTFSAFVKDMEVVDNKFEPGKKQLRVVFELTDFTFEEVPEVKPSISGYYNLSLHENSKLCQKFVVPLLGRMPSKDDCKRGKFDLDRFLDAECSIEIKHISRKSDGGTTAIVEQVTGRSEQE